MRVYLVLSLFALVAFGCGGSGKITSDKGTFEASITGAEKGLKKGSMSSVEVTIFKKGETSPTAVDVKKVSFIHTTMGHGGDVEPEASKASDGKFTIQKLSATMPGEWRLRLELDGGEHIDFNIQVSD